MGGDQAMIAIGIGCRKACPAGDIVELVREALGALPDAAPAGLFSVAEKRGEPGLLEAAATLRLPLVFLDRAILALVAGEARSCSRRVEEMFGLPGIAETAALAGAGQGSVLLVPRRASPTATCAIAGPRPS
jgi:cobalt-precorrin 5A hydrolase